MLIVKYAASWVSETSWDVEFSVHVFSWEVFWLCEVTGCCSLRWLRPFSAVLTLIASLSFLFRSQPCISLGLFPSFPGGGWALHLQSVQSGCCCFCCLFNRPDYRNCLQSGGCLCIPADIQLLPGFACLYPESWHSGRTQWLWFVSYTACVVRLQRLLYQSQSILRVQVCP